MMNTRENYNYDCNYDYHYSYGTGTLPYDSKHEHFGGMVYYGDFDEYHSISDIAQRITSDMRWERNLIKAAKRNNVYRTGGEE